MAVQTLGRVRALVFALLAILVGVLSYLLGVQSLLGQRAEASVLEAAEFSFDPPAPLNLVSIASIALALMLISALALAAHGVRRAFALAVVSVLTLVASQLLKQEMLDRPGLFEFDAPNTFPSGHMTVFTVLTAALIWAVPARLRSFAALGGAAVMGAAGWQLLAFGWHRPSDLLGAQALGVLAFAIAAFLRTPPPGASHVRSMLRRTVSVLLTVAGFALAAVAVGLAVYAGWTSNSSVMLTAGEIGVLGTSAITAQALLLLSPATRR